jgi:hypothetical protein
MVEKTRAERVQERCRDLGVGFHEHVVGVNSADGMIWALLYFKMNRLVCHIIRYLVAVIYQKTLRGPVQCFSR